MNIPSSEKWHEAYNLLSECKKISDDAEKNGLTTVVEFTTGIHPCSLTFIISLGEERLITLCVFDIYDEKRQGEINDFLGRARELTSTDPEELRRDFYEKKLAELNEKYGTRE